MTSRNGLGHGSKEEENNAGRTHVAARNRQGWWEEEEHCRHDDVGNTKQVAHPAKRTG